MKKSKIFFIYSGKGGVGKSTITYNLAYILKKKGYKVGVLDLDLKTPSMYRLFLNNRIKMPRIKNMKIQPAEVDGILVQSTGFFNYNYELFFSDDLIEGAFFQLSHRIIDDVDYLLIDFPPGINKIHSLACEKFKSGNFILVSTYSLLSLEDTNKAKIFINKFNLKISLAILNMSYLKCKNCNYKNYLFNKNNIKHYPSLNSLNIVEIPLSKELIFANEQSKTIIDIKDKDLKGSFDKITKYL